MRIRNLVLLLALTQCLLGSAALGGTIRYDLPELLGEHRYDGTTGSFLYAYAHFDVPFNVYSLQQARLVIEGSVQPGKARGDGIIRQALEFDLDPSVTVTASFETIFLLWAAPTTSSFRIDEIYPYPFVPNTTPMPNPAGYPPRSYSIGLSPAMSLSTNLPPIIDPVSDFYNAFDGVIVDVPIIANVTTAYIELSGPAIVPEPSTAVMALLGLLLFPFRGVWRREKSGQDS